MHAQQFFIVSAAVLTLCLCGTALAEEAQGPYVPLQNLKSIPLSWKAFTLR